MAMQTFQSPDTHNEPEGEATVATETTLDRSVSEGTNAQAAETKTEPTTNGIPSESLNASETPAVAVEVRDVGSSDRPSVAATPPDDFDDEFLTVMPARLKPPQPQPSPISADATSDATPMFSATAGDDAQPKVIAPLAGQPAEFAPKPTERVEISETTKSTVADLVDHFQKISNLETQIANACELELELRDRLKSLRKNREGLVERLTKLKNGDDDADDELDDGDRDLGGESGTASTGTAPATPCPMQAWGTDAIEVLESHGLKPAKVEALRAAADAGNFNGTIRGLRDWIAASDLWHRNVKGCGPTGADKIGDALTSYMLANPMADEPMTAEDERRSEAAAIALGHTKPASEEQEQSPVVTECETTPIAVVPDVVIEPTQAATGATPPVEPVVAKKPRKPRGPNKPKPAAGSGDFHSANAGQLDRVAAMLSGEPDPASTIANEAEANEAGRVAGMTDQSCSANPFPRDHAFGKAWQAGWDATAVGAV